MKILSTITEPQDVSGMYEFFILLNTKDDILKNDKKQTVAGSH